MKHRMKDSESLIRSPNWKKAQGILEKVPGIREVSLDSLPEAIRDIAEALEQPVTQVDVGVVDFDEADDSVRELQKQYREAKDPEQKKDLEKQILERVGAELTPENEFLVCSACEETREDQRLAILEQVLNRGRSIVSLPEDLAGALKERHQRLRKRALERKSRTR